MRLIRLFASFVWLIFLISACQDRVSVPADRSPAQASRKTEAAHDPFNRHGRLVFTRHARCRMDCRHITRAEIGEVLDSGTINYAKSQPDARPDPKYAVEAFTREKQHLRIVVAPSGEKLIVITCIELDVEWQCHCR